MATGIERQGKAGMTPIKIQTAGQDKPIIFSGEMVRAILAGRKTQTRRIIPDRLLVCLDPDLPEDAAVIMQACPYGLAPGRLWVRETWSYGRPGISQAGPHANHRHYYRATAGEPLVAPDFWRPSIHMPRVAARLYLALEAVRVERLQDISVEDALAEGCPNTTNNQIWQFERLWDSINSKRAPWASNPFVYVLQFRKA